MKRLFILVLLAMGTRQLSAQCCPYIIGVELLPATPQAGQPFEIATHVATPNNGHLIASGAQVIGDTIVIDACYYSGLLTIVSEIRDTLAIAGLPAGSYAVKFMAKQSVSADDCVVEQQQDTVTAFSVGMLATGEVLPQQTLMFPNPVTDRLYINGEAAVTGVYTPNGQLLDVTVDQSPEGVSLDVSRLPSGVYLVRMTLKATGAIVENRFIK